MTVWLSILGLGEDGVEGLSPAAARWLADAALVVGGERHLALAAAAISGDTMAWPRPIEDAIPAILARRGQAVVVLASGDPFWFGIGTMLSQHVPAAEMRCLPAPSAFSLAAARLGWSLQDCATLSVCGRPVEALIPALQPGALLLVLCAGDGSPGAVLALLEHTGFAGSDVTLLEALGGRQERCTPLSGLALPDGISPLAMLAVRVVAGPDARPIPLTPGLPDGCFEHDGQLTKCEIRAATLAALAPCRGEMLWDVGAGSGSIGVEWMLRHPANRAVAVERDPGRAARIGRNAASLGVPGLEIVTGAAPAALAELAAPDAVFIGGGLGVPDVLETAWSALGAGGRLVANAVTIEGEAVLFAAHARLGGSLTRLSVARLDRVGGMHGFRPAMSVTQYTVRRP